MSALTVTQGTFLTNSYRLGISAQRIAAALGMEMGAMLAAIAGDADLRERVHAASLEYATDRRTRPLDSEIDHAAEAAGRELSFTNSN